MFKFNNKDTRTTHSIVNFEHVIAGWDDLNKLNVNKLLAYSN